jgi:hypothetical protein
VDLPSEISACCAAVTIPDESAREGLVIEEIKGDNGGWSQRYFGLGFIIKATGMRSIGTCRS